MASEISAKFSLVGTVLLSALSALAYNVEPSGDATTDTAAINTAIQHAAENSVVTLAPGTYKINATITIDRPVTVQGTGWKDCILDAEQRDFKFVVLCNADARLTGVTVANGRAENHFWGLGVTFEGASGTLSDCRVTGCTGRGFCLGAVCASSPSGDPKVFSCIIDHNRNEAGSYQGGGAYMTKGLLFNCLIADNYSACQGAGGFFRSGNVKVVNCTFVRNAVAETSTKVGGGIWTDGNAVILNCCVYGNTCVGGGANINDERNVSYCATPEKLGGNPIELAESPFVDYGGRDYSLKAGCPCIDAGDAKSMTNRVGAANIALDLAGNDRVMGATVDVGCYEFDPNTFTLQLDGVKTTAFPNEKVLFTAAVVGASTEGATFDWTFTPVGGGETIVRQGNPVEFVAADYGWYDADVAFSNGAQTKSAKRESYIRVAPATNYVSAAEVAKSAPPYDSPETAATNIQDAVDEAIPGATIVLLDGTYMITNTILVEKAVTITGSGWDSCTLYGNKTISSFPNPLLRIDASGAKVEGVHITHVYAGKNWTYGAAGIAIGSNGGTLSACRVSDCTDSYGTAGTRGAISIAGPDGVVTRCLIENNAVQNNGYNTAGGIYMTAGRADNCIVCHNTGKGYSATSGQTGGGGGIVATGGLVLNCTVVSNTCLDAEERADVSDDIAIYGTAVVRNCLMQGGTNNFYGAAGTACTYSLVSEDQTVPAGDGNFAGTVQFKNGGFVPCASSVVSRKGCTAGYEDVLVGAVDFYCKPRVRGDGSIDIGCAQANLNGLMLLLR